MIYGETLRAIEGKSGTNIGTLERNLTGINLGFNPFQNMRLSLCGIKSKDESGSIKFAPLPLENTVYGLGVQADLWQERLKLSAEAAKSNLKSSVKETTGQLACQGKIEMNLANHQIGINLSRIDSGFTSLGNSSLPKDKKGIKLIDSFNLFKSMDANLAYEYFHNNLSKNLPSTLKTDILSTQLRFPVGKNSIFKLNYRNYQRGNGQPVHLSGAIDDNIGSFDLSSTYRFRLFRKSNFVQVNYLQSKVKDRVNQNSENKTDEIGFNLNSQISSLVNVDSGYKLTNVDFSAGSKFNKIRTALLGINYLAYSNRLKIFFDLGLTSSTGNVYEDSKSDKTSLNLGMNWNLRNKQSIAANIGWVDFEDHKKATNNYQEKIIQLKFIQNI